MSKRIRNIPMIQASICNFMAMASYAEIDPLFCILFVPVCDPTILIFQFLIGIKLSETDGRTSCRYNGRGIVCRSLKIGNVVFQTDSADSDTSTCGRYWRRQGRCQRLGSRALLHSDPLHKFELKTIDKRIEVSDWRSFAAVLHISPLKAATQFMNGRDTNLEKSKVDTIHRCASYCRSNNFCTVEHSVVFKMYQCPLRA